MDYHGDTVYTRSRRSVTDKRGALLKAALELIARDGLPNVPTSNISRAAGVATGTLFVYFETKEGLLNELYLDLVAGLMAAVTDGLDPDAAPEQRLRQYWFNHARWHFDHAAACNVLQQCEVSSVLTEETHAKKSEMEADLLKKFFPEAIVQLEDPLSRYVLYAMFAGPIQILSQLRDKGEIEISDELLELTFQRVEKALSP